MEWGLRTRIALKVGTQDLPDSGNLGLGLLVTGLCGLRLRVGAEVRKLELVQSASGPSCVQTQWQWVAGGLRQDPEARILLC